MQKFEKASNLLVRCTIKIVCECKDGKTYFGTGFFYVLEETAEGEALVIVTNKHVIKDSIKGTLTFTVTSGEAGTTYKKIEIDEFEEKWILHEDKDVDLCVMPIGYIPDWELHFNENNKLDITPIRETLIPQPENIKGFGAIEDVIMIGYPKGLIDDINMKPITRRGITATDLKNDYKGKKEFLIDIPVFQGSSGSPVFIYNEGAFIGEAGEMLMGSRIFFIGILYSGPSFKNIGTIEGNGGIIDGLVVMTPYLINLGVVIKSNRLLDIKEFMKKSL